MTALILAAILTATPLAEPAAPHYRPDVIEARHWLRERMPRRQFRCLHRLWSNESSWRVRARNRTSGAYGIPQSLPGRKMRSAGRDWRTSALTQVTWGWRYVRARYGTPCRALRFQIWHGWY